MKNIVDTATSVLPKNVTPVTVDQMLLLANIKQDWPNKCHLKICL